MEGKTENLIVEEKLGEELDYKYIINKQILTIREIANMDTQQIRILNTWYRSINHLGDLLEHTMDEKCKKEIIELNTWFKEEENKLIQKTKLIRDEEERKTINNQGYIDIYYIRCKTELRIYLRLLNRLGLTFSTGGGYGFVGRTDTEQTPTTE